MNGKERLNKLSTYFSNLRYLLLKMKNSARDKRFIKRIDKGDFKVNVEIGLGNLMGS